MTKTKPRETVTAEEAAEMIGVHRKTIIEFINKGWLSGYRVSPGKTSPYRIYRDSVESYIREIQGRKG